MTTFQDKLLTKTDCDEAGDYVVPNVLSPRDLVFRPDIGHVGCNTDDVAFSPQGVIWTLAIFDIYGF